MRFRNCCSIKGVVLALALSATSAKLSAEGMFGPYQNVSIMLC